MKEVALGTINNWCRGVIVWNLMLDNDRAPNREGGCQTCYGAVDISNSDYKDNYPQLALLYHRPSLKCGETGSGTYRCIRLC